VRKKVVTGVLGGVLALAVTALLWLHGAARRHETAAQIEAGDRLFRSSSYGDAAMAYERAAKVSRNNPEAWTRLAKGLFFSGQLGRAEEAARRAEELDPGQPDLHLMRASLARLQRRPDDALEWAERALAEDPKSASAQSFWVRCCTDAGQLARARARYSVAVKADPRDAFARRGLGLVLYEEGGVVPALAEYRNAQRLDPTLYQLHSDVAEALTTLGRLGEAEQELRLALAGRSDPVVRLMYGRVLNRQRRYREAEAELRRGLKGWPLDPSGHADLGWALWNLGRVHEAIHEYRNAVRWGKPEARYYQDLGQLLYSIGETDEALSALRRATELGPRSARVREVLGACLADKRQLADAERELRLALAMDPGYAAAHLTLASVLYQMGRYPEAWHQVHEAERLGLAKRDGLVRLLTEKMPEPAR